VPDAEILLFPFKEEPEMRLGCECGSDDFILTSAWIVRCSGCGELVGFWNPFQPVGTA